MRGQAVDGWERFWDDEGQHYYWYNAITQESRWDEATAPARAELSVGVDSKRRSWEPPGTPPAAGPNSAAADTSTSSDEDTIDDDDAESIAKDQPSTAPIRRSARGVGGGDDDGGEGSDEGEGDMMLRPARRRFKFATVVANTEGSLQW